MSTIATPTLETPLVAHSAWPAIAEQTHRWAKAHAVELRDAVVLVPFVQLLPPARRAFALHGGWMPRIETTQTLSAGLGPSPASTESGQISFDAALDALQAEHMLRSQPGGAAWARRDPRGVQRAAAAVVGVAHALARAAAAMPPAARVTHWAQARALLAPMVEPGGAERALLRLALEWAAQAPPPATDRLFGLRPAGWIVVQAGGADALSLRLMSHAADDVPALLIDTDTADTSTLDASRVHAALAVCESFEHEAQCAAAQVLRHLHEGHQPIALIAQDRVLVRRVRALLERRQVAILDETGWKLSTTRAAAQVMALLRAAAADAGTDALLDWLKAGVLGADTPPSNRASSSTRLSALETDCRRLHLWRVAALDHAALSGPAADLWSRAAPLLRALSRPGRAVLHAWLAALAEALLASGAFESLQADEAGREVLKALHLDLRVRSNSRLAADAAMSFSEFSAWVDDALEQASFRPSAPPDTAPQVVITPLAQAILRPFAALVFPGADDKHLGASPASHALLSDGQMAPLGLPNAARRRADEWAAFVHTLALPRITFFHRRFDGANPLATSPLIERLALALVRDARTLLPWVDARVDEVVAPAPIHRSAPAAAALLPQRLSASACEALRACPYRFFALNLLRLREEDELDGDIEKRDYGTWLHEVLHRFHQHRGEPSDAAAELARLHALARAAQAELALDDAAFLPFAASFESFAPRYVAWLHGRDAEGAHWLQGELDVRRAPAELGSVELHGRIDRLDSVARATGPAVQLIDYKTGSAAGLKEKVKQPLEDTQLAFYAALMAAHTEAPLLASYLALDGTKGIEEVAHPDVEHSARTLVAGLADDLQRLRAGAGLPALGEGATCAYCAARGVCRRDHWAVSNETVAAFVT